LKKQKIVIRLFEHDNFQCDADVKPIIFELYPRTDKGSEVVYGGNMKDHFLKWKTVGFGAKQKLSWNDAISSIKIERLQE
jgi:hypothetical protein